MTDLPEPLVPADVDLRGYGWMPFYGHHLLGSDFHARCTDTEWRAGVTLWWAAWNQVPAASLPDDDIALARLADFGRDVKGWKKVRANALHGFVKCSDGRLYHKFLAQHALEAWDRRVKERERKAKWRAGRNGDGDGDKTGTEYGTNSGQPVGQNGRQEKTGQDRTGHGKPTESYASLQTPPVSLVGEESPTPPLPAAGCAAPPARPGGPNSLQQACQRTWDSYALAYSHRYGVEPVRNAKINAQVKQFVQRLGGGEAPLVAAFYVGHMDAFYVRKGHDFGLLLTDAEKLRTEWATNRTITATKARQADRAGTTLSAVQEILAERGEA